MNKLLAVARGDMPADLVIKNARVANVFTLEYEKTDVAISGQKIAGLGTNYEGRHVFDAKGAVLSPGLIDGHVHIESTMLAPPAFADAVVVRGTTTVMADPHEIANVMGSKGVYYMYTASQNLSIDIFYGAPAAVPASQYESACEELDMASLRDMFQYGWCQHFGEAMNFPSIIAGDPSALGKLMTAANVPITGHCPGLSGKNLNAYIAAGVTSDHEATEVEEAREKLRRGMWVMMREGGVSPDLRQLLPLVKEDPARSARCMAVTDDVTVHYLMEKGHMDLKLKIMIEEGLDPLVALRMMTLSPAEYFRLWNRGGIAPGYVADLVLVDSLEEFHVQKVWKRGRLVVDGGQIKHGARSRAMPVANIPTVTPPTLEQIRVPVPEDILERERKNPFMSTPGINAEPKINVIGLYENTIITKTLELAPKIEKDPKTGKSFVVQDVNNDVAKIVVLERHNGTGRLGVGFVKGFGLKRGAIASSVSHDAHNFVVCGMDDQSILTAFQKLCELGGGLVTTCGTEVQTFMPLPIAGLMTYLDAMSTANAIDTMIWGAQQLGTRFTQPFMALSFLCLTVIPELRISDRGYVDLMAGGLRPLFKGNEE